MALEKYLGVFPAVKLGLMNLWMIEGLWKSLHKSLVHSLVIIDS